MRHRYHHCAVVALVLCAATVFATGASAQAGATIKKEEFETRLAPSPHTDGTRANVMGEGHATASLEGNRLTVRGTFHDLPSNATRAALYDGIRIGAMGPKISDINVTPATGGEVSGSVTLTARQANAVRSGRVYIQLDSEKAPDGNLTGWLLPPHPFAGEAVPVAGHGFLPQLDVPQR
ncbi:MAG: hypothetical protein RL274_1433 [Pseudomonadota bacterium]